MTREVTRKLRKHFSLDLRALAAFRIALGLFSIFDVVCRCCDTLAWYTSTDPDVVGEPSLLPPEDTPHGFFLHRFLFYRGPWQLQAVLFTVTGLIALLFTLGWRTKPAGWLLYVLVASYQGRSQHIHDGGDKLLRHLILWSCLLPVSYRWSVDVFVKCKVREQKCKREDGRDDSWHCDGPSVEGNDGEAHFGVASIGLTLQVVALYWVTAARRTGPQWWPPALSAVYYMLAGTFASSPFGNWLARTQPGFCQFATAAGQITEFVAPALLLLTSFTSSFRVFPLVALVGLQLGIAACMWLVNFQIVSILCMLPFVPPSVIDALIRGMPTWLTSLWARGSFLFSRFSEQPRIRRFMARSKVGKSPQHKGSSVSGRLEKAIAAFLLFYTVYHSLGDVGLLSKLDGGNIGEAIRFNQGWNMFGAVSREGHWWVIIGETTPMHYPSSPSNAAGEKKPIRFDMLAWLRHESPAWEALTSGSNRSVEDEPRPYNVASLYRNHRWERYFDQLPQYPSKLNSRLSRLGSWLCHVSPAPLKHVEFYNLAVHINPPRSSAWEVEGVYSAPRVRLKRKVNCEL